MGKRAQTHGSAPMPMLLQAYVIERLALLNERDELGQLTEQVEQMVREINALPGWRAALAWVQVQAGRTESARAELEAISKDRFAAFPRDAHFLPSLAMVAHAVGELGDAELAAQAEPLLAPFREHWVVFGLVAATLGPVAYALGVLQLVLGRVDEAAAFSSWHWSGRRGWAPARTSRARARGSRRRCADAEDGAMPPERRSSPAWRPPTPTSSA